MPAVVIASLLVVTISFAVLRQMCAARPGQEKSPDLVTMPDTAVTWHLRQPEIAAVLADKSMEPNSRVDALTNKVTRQGWQDATKLSGGHIWGAAAPVSGV